MGKRLFFSVPRWCGDGRRSRVTVPSRSRVDDDTERHPSGDRNDVPGTRDCVVYRAWRRLVASSNASPCRQINSLAITTSEWRLVRTKIVANPTAQISTSRPQMPVTLATNPESTFGDHDEHPSSRHDNFPQRSGIWVDFHIEKCRGGRLADLQSTYRSSSGIPGHWAPSAHGVQRYP